MAQYVIIDNTIKIYGTKTARTGSLAIGAYTELYNPATSESLGKTSTDENGYWEFIIAKDQFVSGQYEIRFYESELLLGLPPIGDWEIINVVSSDTEPLVVNTDVVVEITEGTAVVDVNQAQFAIGILSVTNITLVSGMLTEIEVYAKLSSEADWIFVQSVPTKIVASSISQKFVFSLRSKTIGFDFLLKFKSGLGVVGKLEDGTDAVFTLSNLPFNGVADLAELYEVRDLEIINANNGEAGTLFSLFAELRWEDIRSVAQGFFPIVTKEGYGGTDQMLTFAQAQLVTSYEVYMYVTQTSTPPAHQYPANGSGWYYIGSFETANAVVRCPKNTSVAFWVGMKMASTSSSITKNNIQY